MKTAATVALRSVPRAALALPPAWRRRFAVALAAAATLAALYFSWFRDSSFAQVRDVEVTGLSGPQAKSIRGALVDTGLGMTTLHVRSGELRDAVATYPVVRSVSATGDFPHRLVIEVQLNLPVAALQTPAGRVPVTADGALLRDVPLTPGLPTLVSGRPAPPERVQAGRAFTLLHAVAAAPPALRSRILKVRVKAGTGLVVDLRRGPDLLFGTRERMAAKWIAAARVLASPAARGATYIDLRLPERPAAGGLSTTGVLPLAPAGGEPVAPPPAQPTPTQTATTPAPTETTPTQTAPPAATQPPANTLPTATQPTATASPEGAAQAPE